MEEKQNNRGETRDRQTNEAGSGNASNPGPEDTSRAQPASGQFLDKKAEKYLRESGNIEDLPDPQEQQEAEQIIKEANQDRGSAD